MTTFEEIDVIIEGSDPSAAEAYARFRNLRVRDIQPAPPGARPSAVPKATTAKGKASAKPAVAPEKPAPGPSIPSYRDITAGVLCLKIFAAIVAAFALLYIIGAISVVVRLVLRHEQVESSHAIAIVIMLMIALACAICSAVLWVFGCVALAVRDIARKPN